MKRFELLFLIFLLYGYTAMAQDEKEYNGTLQLGVGGTIIGEWDQKGIVSFVQYQHKMSDYFSITPRISSLIASGAKYIGEKIPGEEIYSQSSGLALDIDLNYAPFRRFKNNFYLSVGPSARYLQQTYPQTVSKRRLPDGTTTFEVDQDYYSGYAFGGTVAINLAATISPKVSLGGRVSLQGYTSGSMIPFYGLVFGYKL